MQRVTPDIGTMFQTIEDALHDTFLPALFKGGISQIPGRAVTGLPVKQAMIALPEPTQTLRAKWMASCVITGHLVSALCGTAEFWSGNHAFFMIEVRDDIRWKHAEYTETSLGEARASASTEDYSRMVRITWMRVCLSVILSTVNGIKLRTQEYSYSVFMRYKINLSNLPEYLNRCGTVFYICHALDCKK